MKTTLFIAFCILCSGYVQAQKIDGNFDEWGKVSPDELKMTECSFDKEANAILLLDLAHVYYSKQEADFISDIKYFVTIARYQRYKVLSKKGGSVAIFSLAYNTHNKEEINNITAVSYNPGDNGETKKMELKEYEQHTVKLNENVSQITFMIPGVTKGSVFELRYEKKQRLAYTLPEWYFTSSIPCAKSSITIGFLNGIDYYIDKHLLTNKFEEKSFNFTSDIYISTASRYYDHPHGNAKTYTALDIPAYTAEPYINSPKNYMSWIGFEFRNVSSDHSFKAINSSYYKTQNFSENLVSNAIPQELWWKLLKDSMNEEQKTAVIFDFIRTNIKPTTVHTSTSLQSANHIWKSKTGNPTEINLMLINTLNKAGIKAYPILVGPRSYGYKNTSYPRLGEFTQMVAFVEADNKHLILDATEKFLPARLPKFEFLNTYGLVLQANADPYWYQIKDQNTDHSTVLINAELDNDGKIKGEMTIVNDNYTANNYRIFRDNNLDKLISDELTKLIPNASIESVSDTMNISNGQYTQTITFITQPTTDNDGTIYISIPSIYGSSANPFTSSERSSDVDFGYAQSENIVMNLRIPEQYEADSLFKPIRLSMHDNSIQFLYQVETTDNNVTLMQKKEYKKTFYAQEDYPAFYDFHLKYYDLRQRPIILRRKK